MLHILSITAGCFLLYLAIFLYEDEENKLQNKLDDWWIMAHDLNITLNSRQLSFVLQLAKSVERFFNSVFGEKLLSARSILISAYLSIATALLFLFLPFVIRTSSYNFSFLFFLVGVTYLAIGVLLAIGKLGSRAWITGILICPVISLIQKDFQFSIGYIALITLAVLSDFASICATRFAIKKIATATKFQTISIFFLIDILIVAALVVLPRFTPDWEWIPVASSGVIFFILSYANLTTAIPSLVVLMAGAGMLLHRITWPIIVRVMYTPINHKLIKNRKSLIGLSALLLGWGGIPFAETGSDFITQAIGLE